MSREISYFRIGSFVIIGLTLAILALIILGSGKIFQKKIYIETYFNESVQGLTVGSPVKYRGLDIGNIDKISFVNQIYKKHKRMNGNVYSRYIYVKAAITSDLITGAKKEALYKVIQKDIAGGLRFRLALQGLTGNAYLELNYVNPKTNHPPPIDWTPENYYIPSTTSTLTRVSDNISFILDELKQVDLQQLFGNLQNLTKTTNSVMKKTNNLLLNTNQQIANTFGNLRNVSERASHFPASLLFGGPPAKVNPRDL